MALFLLASEARNMIGSRKFSTVLCLSADWLVGLVTAGAWNTKVAHMMKPKYYLEQEYPKILLPWIAGEQVVLACHTTQTPIGTQCGVKLKEGHHGILTCPLCNWIHCLFPFNPDRVGESFSNQSHPQDPPSCVLNWTWHKASTEHVQNSDKAHLQWFKNQRLIPNLHATGAVHGLSAGGLHYCIFLLLIRFWSAFSF